MPLPPRTCWSASAAAINAVQMAGPRGAALQPAMVPSASLLPLQGVTVLAVEDSRYASDALRLICRRLGARLRRAEDLRCARQHLRCYRPDAVLVDLGLPDGRGEELIAELTARPGHATPVVLAMSGDPVGAQSALRAGAAAFLAKPFAAPEAFAAILQPFLALSGSWPEAAAPEGHAALGLQADLLALRDDLQRAERMLRLGLAPRHQSWLAGFLAGLADQSGDLALAEASRSMRLGADTFVPVAALLRERIANATAFARHYGKGGAIGRA